MAVVSAIVSIEPWDSESRFSSRMVWRDASGRRPTYSMLTVGERMDISNLVGEVAP